MQLNHHAANCIDPIAGFKTSFSAPSMSTLSTSIEVIFISFMTDRMEMVRTGTPDPS